MKLPFIFYSLILIALFSMSCATSKPKEQVLDRADKVDIVIKSNEEKASLRLGENFWPNSWTILNHEDPNIWHVMPSPNESIRASYITDVDSISFDVKEGDIYSFKVVLNDTIIAYKQIIGVGPRAKFSQAYQKKYRGKTIIEIPDIYELINVVFALTTLSAEEDSHVVKKDTPYHAEVLDWFAPFKSHEVVMHIDSILRSEFNMYFGIKMDAYIYEFTDQSITSKGTYDRLAQKMGISMVPPELINLLEDFAKVSNFKTFYNNQQAFYHSQINYYKNDLNIANMQKWLNQNYPKTSYDCFRVIFSPLVDWNQSAAWLDADGFKEAQAHVNFPYPRESDKNRTDAENVLVNGSILFTEFNHAFNDPESEPYLNSAPFKEAFNDLSFWSVEDSFAARGYAQPSSLFNEMMNWSLVSLYRIDNASDNIDLDKLIASTEDGQTHRRGFKHFKPFNQHLIKLYINREAGQTVADLYPQIIEWCQLFKRQHSK